MERRRRSYGPTSSIAEPRRVLLLAVRSFVREAGGLPGVLRIALVGSLTTAKIVPKDADVLVSIDPGMDLETLARAGRRLKGRAQAINLGADVFLADKDGCYLGRICHYRECFPRVLCRARHCGVRQHLNDDLDIVRLPADLVGSPPLELWPSVVRRCVLPSDVETLLLNQE
jgi:hypothetical protein